MLCVVSIGCGEDDPEPAKDMGQGVDQGMDMATDVEPDLEPDLEEEGCPALTGPGTDHMGSLSGSQVWTAAGSPHRVTFQVTVAEGETLTLEPCAVVLMEAQQGIFVRGALEAQGTQARPVRIEAMDLAKPFSSIRVERTGSLRLAHTRVAGGGDGTLIEAMVEARGAADAPRREALHMEHVVLEGSKTFGVWLEGDAAISASSQALTIRGAALGPMTADPRAAGTLPPGVYTGNGVDEVRVTSTGASWQLDEDTRWAARGVPYRLEGLGLRVGAANTDAPPVTWTLEPGVVVRVAGGEVLMNARRTMASPDVDVSNGTLVAVGSADAPITFAGADPTPGSWRGLVFRAAPTPQSRLEHVVIAHAGGRSGANGFHCSEQGMGQVSRDEDAALTLFGPPPAATFVTSSTIRASAADGINHAYYGELTDLLPTNTFEQIARCHQTMPRPREGQCPQAAYCPKAP